MQKKYKLFLKYIYVLRIFLSFYIFNNNIDCIISYSVMKYTSWLLISASIVIMSLNKRPILKFMYAKI